MLLIKAEGGITIFSDWNGSEMDFHEPICIIQVKPECQQCQKSQLFNKAKVSLLEYSEFMGVQEIFQVNHLPWQFINQS